MSDLSAIPLHDLEVALCATTERLAAELHHPTPSPPAWTELEWRIAQAVCAMQGISALLGACLRWRGPDFWEAFLQEQRVQTALRDRRISQLRGEIDALIRGANLTLVAMKGTALIELGICDGSVRPRSDIDLLAMSEDDAAATQELLGAIGFRESYSTHRHRILSRGDSSPPIRFGEHVENPIKIELHTRVAEQLPVAQVDITAGLLPSRRQAGLIGYPSLAALMRHLLLHASGNMRANALRLIQLYDIVRLAPHLRDADWIALVEHETAWSTYPPLSLTDRYFPGSIPARVIDAVRAAAPWPLRYKCDRYRLCDVSWSQLRIFAFPGIEWSRSVQEAARFIVSRLFPSKHALHELWLGTRSTPWLQATNWYGRSHTWRIARWISSRPPRPQTVHSVQLAFRSSQRA